MDFDPLRSFHSRLLKAIHGIGESDLRRPEQPGKWSILDVIAHLSDLELVAAVRFRDIVAVQGPALQKLEQDAWVSRVHGGESRDSILEHFWFLRRMNAGFLERLEEGDFSRLGLHAAFGDSALGDLVAHLIRHQEKHLGQIERIKSALSLTASSEPSLDGVVATRAGAARSPGEGVRVREMWRGGVRRALRVEFDPGAQWPGLDYHIPGPEEVYVVSGDFNDGRGKHGPGTFLHHPAGSSHSPRSEEGCVLFVFYPEG
jgi:hypothetical protein